MEFRTKNPFIANVVKYIGRDVVVQVEVGGKPVEYKGYCESIDFHNCRIILKLKGGETLLLPDFVSVCRSSQFVDKKKLRGDRK